MCQFIFLPALLRTCVPAPAMYYQTFWYLPVWQVRNTCFSIALVSTSLASEATYPFVSLRTTFMSFSIKYYSVFSFLYWVVFYIMIPRSSLYSREIRHYLWYAMKMFSWLCLVSFLPCRILSFYVVEFINIFWLLVLRKPDYKKRFPMVSSVLWSYFFFTFKTLIHLEFTLVEFWNFTESEE